MGYDRDEYMRAQEAQIDLISMRTPCHLPRRSKPTAAVETDRLRRALLDALDEFTARNESGAVPNWVLVARAQREEA